MKRRVIGQAVCALALLAAGCGTARYVQRTQVGGTLALEGERQEAMKEAQKLMTEHCRGPYTIISEGETVIGTETAHQDETIVTKKGKVVNKGAEVTRQATEWRVNYQCGDVPPPPPGMPAYVDPNQPPPQ
jgi:hypothetical protein